MSAPPNSLRQSDVQRNGEVLRWGSGNKPLRDEGASKSFSQVLTPTENQTKLESHRAVAVSSRMAAANGLVAKVAEQSAPRSGFELSPPTKRIANSPVQFASYEETSTEASRMPEPRMPEPRMPDAQSSGVWYDRTVAQEVRSSPSSVESAGKNSVNHRTNVQRAKFQEPLGLPPAPERMPIVPSESLPGNSLDQNSTRALNEVFEPAPFKTQLPPSKPGRSLLEQPEPIQASPFPSAKSLNQENVDRSLSDKNKRPRIDSKEDPAPTPPLDRRVDRSVIDCDAMRALLISESDITRIRVDSSPSFVGGKNNSTAPTNTKEGTMASARSRSWLSYEGQVVAEGKMVDLTLGSVVIEEANGVRVSYLLHKLSDADQLYVSEKWGLPVTCAIDDRSFPRRDFTDTTVTWKASGACHKPLYFEDVKLERYGHEWGPVAQPFLSTAHFFGDVLVLPYKMGIHPPNECQYSLGYYRPGSCAPWTVGPVPISLRGALMQAKVVTGAALVLP